MRKMFWKWGKRYDDTTLFMAISNIGKDDPTPSYTEILQATNSRINDDRLKEWRVHE